MRPARMRQRPEAVRQMALDAAYPALCRYRTARLKHCDASVQRQRKGEPGQPGHFYGNPVINHQPDKARHQCSRGGTWQTLKETLVKRMQIGVEARQPQRSPAQYTNAAIHPQRPRPLSTHSYIISAGAAPKETISDKLSYCSPNALCVFVIRAMRPSMPSSTIAKKIAIAAVSKCAFIARTIAKKPQNSAAVVSALGSR